MRQLIALLLPIFVVFVSGCTATPATNDAMEKDAMQNEDAPLAQHASYLPYTKAGFDEARVAGKVIYLEFYAPWCPFCRAQEPKIAEAFDVMAKDSKYDTVQGFKVDYDNEKELKQKYGITYQHSHVILNGNGDVVVKSIGEQWSSEDVIENVNKAL